MQPKLSSLPFFSDYCNSLLCGSPQFILDKFQRVHNSAARLVMKSRKCDHVQPLLRSLHWLPVSSRIDYKISTLCFNTFTNSSLVYIAQLLSVCTPSRHLRSSSDTRTLRIPFVKPESFGRRTFSFTGVPVSSPSHGGDVTVYVLDINQPSLPTPVYSILVSLSVFMTLSTAFHFHDNSPFS